MQDDILNLCLNMDSLAEQTYAGFAAAEPNKGLAEAWRLLSRDEAQHVGYWRLLLQRSRHGAIPPIFEDPEISRRSLEASLVRLSSRLASVSGPMGAQESLSIACSIEADFLDQTLLQLLHFIRVVSDGPDPFTEYQEHLNRVLCMVNTSATCPELRLIGETISRLWTDNRRLLDSSFVDPLTGILKRRGFARAVLPLISLARRKEWPVSVLMIDVDRFKQINDAYGHDAGDCVLREVASILAQGFRGSDVSARLGGDEFVLFLSECGRDPLQGIGEKIRSRVEELAMREGVTVSIGGTTVVPDDGTPCERLLAAILARADEALYSAKREGRNRVAVPD